VSTSIIEVLSDAQRRGFLGPGQIDDFVAHARGYLGGGSNSAIAELTPKGRSPDKGGDWDECVDLGSGGGIPGLVLALELPGSRWHLVDRSRARTDWLTRSVARLGLQDRVIVIHQAAEATGRGPLRGTCSVAVARSFGRPAVAAECAAPLLRTGGRAVFSDLDGSARWDDVALRELGLAPSAQWVNAQGSYVAFEQRAACPERFPRAAGVPGRRPLF
jgi:16S rRNA (guanine527-N7)-methyltransferase